MVPKHSLGEIPIDAAQGQRLVDDQGDRHRSVQVEDLHARASRSSSSALTTTGAAHPKLDGIIRRQFQDPATALLAFEAGEIDFTYVTGDEVARDA